MNSYLYRVLQCWRHCLAALISPLIRNRFEVAFIGIVLWVRSFTDHNNMKGVDIAACMLGTPVH